MIDRREFMAYFTTAGLSGTLLPGALYALAQDQQTVTREMVAQAEKIAGLEFTDEERDQIARTVNGRVRNYEQIRALNMPNSVPPAVQFDPLLPGMKLPTERRAMRYTRERVSRPANLEEVAFWPVTKLAELVRTKQVMPSELTGMYLARLKRHDARLFAVV